MKKLEKVIKLNGGLKGNNKFDKFIFGEFEGRINGDWGEYEDGEERGYDFDFMEKNDDEDLCYIDDLSDEQIEEFKDKKIVTADPGKKYLLYMIDDENKVLKYSSGQRSMESLNTRNRRIKETNKKQHQEIIENPKI